jgi:hypothetical protein
MKTTMHNYICYQNTISISYKYANMMHISRVLIIEYIYLRTDMT